MTISELKRDVRKDLNTAAQHLAAANKTIQRAAAKGIHGIPSKLTMDSHDAAEAVDELLSTGRAWWNSSSGGRRQGPRSR